MKMRSEKYQILSEALEICRASTEGYEAEGTRGTWSALEEVREEQSAVDSLPWGQFT